MALTRAEISRRYRLRHPRVRLFAACEQCGKEYPRRTNSKVCSDSCRGVKKRAYTKDYYRRSGDTKQRQYRYAGWGSSFEIYRALEIAQQGECAICGRPETSTRTKRLTLDHNHQTGKTRGLLCGDCNLGIGKLGDSSVWLRQAALYIEAYE